MRALRLAAEHKTPEAALRALGEKAELVRDFPGARREYDATKTILLFWKGARS